MTAKPVSSLGIISVQFSPHQQGWGQVLLRGWGLLHEVVRLEHELLDVEEGPDKPVPLPGLAGLEPAGLRSLHCSW
eukprot:CAMPEP_0197659370 /NCGR_PEP_ID=MMETSP1338-20131121/47425_1 /TAXON_ID=43686 ORGANISM="Pelagodinium beii, Strain RCC1491" /NCGR_SAMPLE_ID=MMETSP1338 /ASSEMBLY_ACC=CAM_ASM_000754 /LENGTH=75 /DNA_ID=CAMNT_0043236267 /DNA_START=278 /DNA_END=505 /DNA_ORIENTATION=-